MRELSSLAGDREGPVLTPSPAPTAPHCRHSEAGHGARGWAHRMLRTTATADGSQASFPQARFSRLLTTLKALSGSAILGNTASFLGGGDSAVPHPCPVTPPPPGRARAGSSQPPLPGRPTLPHQQPDTCQEARRGGALVGRTGDTVCVWGGCQAARALPQHHGERAWLCEVSAVARAGADVLFGAMCAAFWGADGHRPLLTAAAC